MGQIGFNVSLRGLWLCFLVFSGCRESSEPQSTATQELGFPRIVSLSPAISRTLVDFELEDQMVGRTPYCESIPQDIPIVGDLYNLDYEMLIRVNPTHILLQPPSSGIDSTLKKLAKEHNWSIGSWMMDTIDDIEQMVRELPGVLYEHDQERFSEAASRAARLTNELASSLSPEGKHVYRGRTLIMSGLDPVLAYGPGTFLYEMYRSLGGANVVETKGYPMYSLEDVVRLNPEAIVIIKPFADEGVDPLSLLGALSETPIKAVQSGRLGLLIHPDALLPSTGLIGVATEMREILVSFATNQP